MIGWNFPPNGGGQEEGLNNAGIETFRGKPESLAREVIQNSLDARDCHSTPVEVVFEVFDMSSADFPGLKELQSVLLRCRKYWEEDKDASNFFDRALSTAGEQSIKFMRISDYNTTGLLGADNGRKREWHKLVKSVGVSGKASMAGGTFGIGKHAPFACSELRTVFYFTKDNEGTEAFQGVSKLVTHEKADEEICQATGYFGIIEGNKPIINQNGFRKLGSFLTRNEIGSDIFVAGFKNDDNWDRKIIKSTLENFFPAVFNNDLIVRAGGKKLNSGNMPSVIEDYLDDEDFFCQDYYSALTSRTRKEFKQENFEGLGSVKLYLIRKRGACKKIAMVRSLGMKIFDKGQFRTPMNFSGVMIAEGEDLNNFLRDLEPPAHDDWQPDRHQNPEYAKKVRKKLYGWLNKCVADLAEEFRADEADVEGMEKFLPDDLEDSPLGNPEGEKSEPAEVILKPDRKKQSSLKRADDSEDIFPGGIEEEIEGKRQPENEGRGHGGGGPAQIGDGEIKQGKRFKLKFIRTFCRDFSEGKYTILFVPEVGGMGYLILKLAGDDSSDWLEIINAKDERGGEIQFDGMGRIGPLLFQKEAKQKLEIELDVPFRCSLEVSAYEAL